MNKKQEEIARPAQKANKKGWTFDLNQIYQDYIDAIGKDELTSQEKQQALLNHVLEQGLTQE